MKAAGYIYLKPIRYIFNLTYVPAYINNAL